MADAQFLTDSRSSAIETNKVLKNTYMLLSMTLALSAVTAGIAMAVDAPHLGLFALIPMFGLLFLTMKFKDSSIGLLCVFAFTGFMGFTIGPMLNFYMSMANGAQIVSYAFGTTAVAFLALSGYAITTKKDFSFMGPMLMVGMLVIVCAIIANFFLAIPSLALAISSMVVLIMAGMMLHQTSAIVNGGETNYIMATVSLYLSLYNMFTSLLHIFGALGGED